MNRIIGKRGWAGSALGCLLFLMVVPLTGQTEWTDRTQAAGLSGWLRGVAWGEGRFVAVGETGGVVALGSSPDGETWTNHNPTGAISGFLYDVAYGDDQFVAVGSMAGDLNGPGRFVVSEDGENWTAVPSSPLVGGVYRGVAYGNGTWVAVGRAAGLTLAAVATSSNGEDWTVHSTQAGIAGELNDVIFAENRFYAVGQVAGRATIFYSNNGVNWTSAVQNQIIGGNALAIAYSETLRSFVAVGERTPSGGSTRALVLTSRFGTSNWQDFTDEAQLGIILRGLDGSVQPLVGVGRTSGPGGLALSSDGESWANLTAQVQAPGDLDAVAYGDGTWVAVGGNGVTGVVLVSGGGAGGNPDPVNPFPKEMVFNADGSVIGFSSSVSLQGEGDFTWTADPTEDWIAVDPPNGLRFSPITVSVDPNPGSGERSGMVFFNGSPISITQLGQGQLPDPDPPGANFNTDGSVRLTWTPVHGADSYDIQRREGDSGQWVTIATGILETSHTDPDPPGGIDLAYRIRVNAPGGSSDWSSARELIAPPSPPGNIQTTASVSSVDLTWDPARGAWGYLVEREFDDGGFVSFRQVARLTAEETTFIDTFVWPQTTFRYRIASLESEFDSPQVYSAIIEVTTPERTNFIAWDSVSSAFGSYNGVAFGAGRFVAVGPNGRVDTIERPANTVVERFSGVQSDLFDIAHGPRFVAVGAGGTLLGSADGTSWESHDSMTASDLLDVAWGNGHFLAVGYGGTVLRSADGTAWESLTPPEDGLDLVAVAHGDGIFMVIAGDGRFFQTAEGDSWTMARGPSPGDPGNLGSYPFFWTRTDIAYASSSDTWAAVGPAGYYSVSTDGGQTWTEGTDFSFNYYEATTYSAEKETLANVAINGYTSTGPGTAFFNGSVVEASLFGVAYGDGQFLAVGERGLIVLSDDGRGWVVLAPPQGADAVFEFVADFGDLSLALTEDALFVDNGTGWRDAGFSHRGLAVAFGEGQYLMVGRGGYRARSTDGLNWTELEAGSGLFNDNLDSIVFADGRFVMGGPGGLSYSDDGGLTLNPVTVEEQLPSQLLYTRGLAFGNETFAAVGIDFEAWSSDDGMDWTPATVNRLEFADEFGSSTAFGVTDGIGRFVTVDFFGSLDDEYGYGVSTDGLTWNAGLAEGFSDETGGVRDLAAGNGIFLAATGFTVLASFDGRTWEQPPDPGMRDQLQGATSVAYDGQGFLVGTYANILRLMVRDSNVEPPSEGNPEVLDFFPGAGYLVDEWYQSEWFGFFNALNWPWVLHLNHGWFYAAGEGGSEVWLSELGDLGWWWTTPDFYPWIYSQTRGTWMLYVLESMEPRWFYEQSAQSPGWISLP